jgi:ADP-ribose pyrophosphatase YjhB (NUDIX family)
MTALGVNIAIVEAGRVLLTRREDFEVWCMPGGAVDPGESIAQAAVREALEETGIQVRLTRLVGIYSTPLWNVPGIHIVVFAAEPIGGSLRPQPGEVVDIGYFDPAKLPSELLLGQRRRILDALGGITGQASSRDSVWPFQAGMTRAELYAMRDRSGLSRGEFYARHVAARVTEGETVEVPGRTSDE